jgi:hypothetical protein
MTADAPASETLHETSLAVWDIPTAAAGERFAVKIGAKSEAGYALAGYWIDVLDGTGAVVASGRLGAAPWPGTDALFWAEVELDAPAEPGAAGFSVRFDAGQLDEPHSGAALAFDVPVVARAEHNVTVKVTAGGASVQEAYVRLGPYRGVTDAGGVAAVKVAKGSYELVMWKAGYDAPTMPLAVEADATVAIDAKILPEDDPDSHWTA